MPDVAIIGAGPAGLTAAYLLGKAGLGVSLAEADPINVGGISRTVEYKGYRLDIGGHRFYSKSQEIENLWTEILPDDMLTSISLRSSKILASGNRCSPSLPTSRPSWSPIDLPPISRTG
jgi:protoporphyrinogen oxidase